MSEAIKVKKLDDRAILPRRGSSSAAGADIFALLDSTITVRSGETVMINTGIALEIPEGFVGLVCARSGLSCKYGVAPANKVGVIDSDYRGELIVALFNHSNESRDIANGDRIAQLVIVPYLSADFCETDQLGDTMRGLGGFGSTGI